MDRFFVRQITTLDEAGQVLLPRRAALGWKPGTLDHVGSYAVCSTGLFAGELDGKVISCICVLKYCEEYAFISHWIVDKEFRGKGYGSAIWKYSLATLPGACICALDAEQDTTHIYSRYGFKSAWQIQHILIEVSKVNIKQLYARKNGCTIISASIVSFEALEKFDTSVHIYARSQFLKVWLFADNCYSYAALDNEKCVVGYAVVRSAYNTKDGWIIGPLFANDSHIARALYHEIVKKIAEIDSNTSIMVVVPYGQGCNSETLDVVNELSGVGGSKFVRMYKNGTPALSLHKIFGITHVG